MSRRKFLKAFISLIQVIVISMNPFRLLRFFEETNNNYYGIGVAVGDNRAAAAANYALTNKIPYGIGLQDAQKVQFKTASSHELMLFELEETIDIIYNNCQCDADVEFITIIDEALTDELRVEVTGLRI